MRIAPEGWVVIVPVVIVALGVPAAAMGLSHQYVLLSPLALAGVLLAFWAFWFFRDPARTTPSGDDLVISPADGKVIKVDMAVIPADLSKGLADVPSGPVPRVSIFLNLLNVHVNRTPAAGRIERIAYRPGKYFNASLDKASEFNERSGALMRDVHGRPIAFVQIAGLVARRIVNHLQEGQSVGAGERFGLIRFGSRAEVYMPVGTVIEVKAGDTVVAGETVMARMMPAARPGVTVAPIGQEARA